ncbi:MAG: hypothetical protein ACRC7N_15720 [Clostridium sp.]
MIIAINYADDNFREAQKFNTMTAYKYGQVDKVIEYSPKDIDEEFYKRNIDILSQKRGGGYWLWKPYIILKTMKEMYDGDYLFYCDSGAAYINKVNFLVNSLEKSKQDIMVFELPLVEKQWTQKVTLNTMECEKSEYTNTNQRLATYLMLKVNSNSKNIMESYLELCRNKEILIDNNSEESELISHRHDQSILSLLSKREGLEPFRDPSQYGIRPWEYLANGRMYRAKKYTNSNYPQILVSFRKANPKSFIIKDKVKFVLTKLGVLNEKQFIRKNKIEIKSLKI